MTGEPRVREAPELSGLPETYRRPRPSIRTDVALASVGFLMAGTGVVLGHHLLTVVGGVLCLNGGGRALFGRWPRGSTRLGVDGIAVHSAVWRRHVAWADIEQVQPFPGLGQTRLRLLDGRRVTLPAVGVDDGERLSAVFRAWSAGRRGGTSPGSCEDAP